MLIALLIFLATLALVIWQPRGLGIGWGQYCRIGVVLTVPVLLAALLGLAGWLALLR